MVRRTIAVLSAFKESVGSGQSRSHKEVLRSCLLNWASQVLLADRWVVLRWNQLENRTECLSHSESMSGAALQSIGLYRHLHKKLLFPTYSFERYRAIPYRAGTLGGARDVDSLDADHILCDPGGTLGPEVKQVLYATLVFGDSTYAVVGSVKRQPIEEAALRAAVFQLQGGLSIRITAADRDLRDSTRPEGVASIPKCIDAVFKVISIEDSDARRLALQSCLSQAVNEGRPSPSIVLVHQMRSMAPDAMGFDAIDVRQAGTEGPVLDALGDAPRSVATFAAALGKSLCFPDLRADQSEFATNMRIAHLHPKGKGNPVRAYLAGVPGDPWKQSGDREAKALRKATRLGLDCERYVCTAESAQRSDDVGESLRLVERILFLYHSLLDLRRLASLSEDSGPESSSGSASRSQYIEFARDGWQLVEKFWAEEYGDGFVAHSPRTGQLMSQYCELLRRQQKADLCYFLRLDLVSGRFLPHGIAVLTETGAEAKVNRDVTTQLKHSFGLRERDKETPQGKDRLSFGTIQAVLSDRLASRRNGRTWHRYNSAADLRLEKLTDGFVPNDPLAPPDSAEGYSVDRLGQSFPWLNGWPFGSVQNARSWGVIWFRWRERQDPAFRRRQEELFANTRDPGFVLMQAIGSLYNLLRLAEERVIWDGDGQPID